MFTPITFTKAKSKIATTLEAHLQELGFKRFNKTTTFFRDTDQHRDVLMFQKMRNSSICVAYGISPTIKLGDEAPGIKIHRWLDEQKFFNVKYEEQVVSSIDKILDLINSEVTPWLKRAKL